MSLSARNTISRMNVKIVRITMITLTVSLLGPVHLPDVGQANKTKKFNMARKLKSKSIMRCVPFFLMNKMKNECENETSNRDKVAEKLSTTGFRATCFAT